jgi:hypothetical protein
MLIDAVFPAAVGAKDMLLRRLITLARKQQMNNLDELVGPVPVRLLNARCFFDRMTQRWRYEYGLPLTSIQRASSYGEPICGCP